MNFGGSIQVGWGQWFYIDEVNLWRKSWKSYNLKEKWVGWCLLSNYIYCFSILCLICFQLEWILDFFGMMFLSMTIFCSMFWSKQPCYWEHLLFLPVWLSGSVLLSGPQVFYLQTRYGGFCPIRPLYGHLVSGCRKVDKSHRHFPKYRSVVAAQWQFLLHFILFKY